MDSAVTSPYSVRDLVCGIWDTLEFAKGLVFLRPLAPGLKDLESGGCRTLQDLRAYLQYMHERPSWGKKRTPMDVKLLVEKWVPIIRGLSTAHEKAPIDACEFVMDEHLTPLLAAPVAQIREFYGQLVSALKADPTIPFFVWVWFESWGDTILKDAPDGDIKELKITLATEIAELVEKDVQPDLKAAIAGALQWRGPQTLERIKGAVEKGSKAKLVGKESCLFLEVETEDGMERVML